MVFRRRRRRRRRRRVMLRGRRLLLVTLRRLALSITLSVVCNRRLIVALVQITFDLQMSTDLAEDIVEVDIQLSTSTLLFNLLLNLFLELFHRTVLLRTVLGRIQDQLSTVDQSNPGLAFHRRLAHGTARTLRLPTCNMLMEANSVVWQCSSTLGKDDSRHYHREHAPSQHRPAMSCVRTSRNIDHILCTIDEKITGSLVIPDHQKSTIVSLSLQ